MESNDFPADDRPADRSPPPRSRETRTYTTVGPDARTYDRYAQVRLEDDALLVYDRDEETAWIQSDDPVALADVE